jgi:hypothetical protein
MPFRLLDRSNTVPAIVLIALVIVAAVFIRFSLRRPTIDAWPPTPPLEREAGDARVGPVQYTVDASSPDRWVFFDFSRGSVVPRGDPLAWDLAFQRFHIIANGGNGFPGKGGIRDLGEVAFDSIAELPADGYVRTEPRSDSTNPAIARWYTFGWTSHLLKPQPHVWAVRTADGRFAIIRILSYYCPGAIPGCLTFEYIYLGAGGRTLH